ncbi:PGF-CTERM sorting domain-containing protein (plasmid) [Haloterrigena salifodinae]|uniref:PGF-CTERM sorting domain-containing protein n=1 Tax=Haloterrigena salifodinae TaxID=2675099 RepID=A0A8T8E7D9_9EURY|nr:PGF-CTERM sorting domain-containing protein [Haloterrigena salifodinae]QRV17587.1 PGF-CTERM sorting domain-containing protein [Haloterrigena salifodinae]
MIPSRTAVAAGLMALLLVGSLGVAGMTAAASSAPAADATAGASAQENETAQNVSEEAYVEPAPEEGELYYEASNGDWVSYVNPRDEYRSPYLGDGSGKIGVTLLNEAGEPIVGKTVPNTTVTIPTGETTSWHSHADPVTVQFPLTEHYDRPLDADQFGTTDDLPQGDGYMDSHTIEMHGHPEDATIEYGEAQVSGEHADKIEVVGYIQKAHDTWETDIDPLEAAEPYEEAGGGWTYEPNGSHGQVIVVLQLDSDVTGADGGSAVDDGTNDSTNSTDGENTSDPDNETETSPSDETNGDDGNDDGGSSEMPGFGVPAVVIALTVAALVAARRAG